MGVRGSLVSLFVSAFVMAIFWQIIDMGVNIGLAENFLGKIIVSGVVIVISKILSKALGG